MTPERFQKVDQLFQAAMELPAHERTTFLDNACAGDDALRNEVEALIASDEHGLSFIEDPAFEMAANLLVHTPPELAKGYRLSNYKILDLIGTGGMGQVYLAEDTELGRNIAIKLLPSEYTKDQDRLLRFRQEARAASALNHPNILTIHQIAQFEGRHFMATEFVDGETLRQRMKRSQLSFAEAIEIGNQVGGALAAAHEAGIVHRDIKPENIMLRRDGYIKVLDFGLAKLTEPTSAIQTTTGKVDSDPGLVMGTVKYMSPEQARGLEVDGRSDIFSFGVVLYEMLTGRAPFTGATTSDLIAALLKEEPAPLNEYVPKVPDDLQRLLSKCLNKKKDERYQTIQEVLVDLKPLRMVNRVASGEPLSQIGEGSEFSTGASGAVTSTLSVEYIVSGIKRHKSGAAIVLAGLLFVGVGSTFGVRRFIQRSRIPSGEMKITRVLNTENSFAVAISPDGRYIAHGSSDAGKGSVWLIEAATNKSIAVSSGGSDLTFSRNGSHLYYNNDGNLFEVPTNGGEARKVLSEVSGPITLAPDGRRFAFVRELNAEESALMIANLDGGEQQQLIRQKKPQYLCPGPAWSPDGSLIAYGFGVTASNKQAGVAVVDVNTSQTREVTNRRWQDLERLAWLSDGSGLIMPATDNTTDVQIFLVPFPSGEPRTITKDLNNYTDPTLTADDGSLVAIQYQQRNSLWIVPNGNASGARPLNTGKHELYRVVSCARDGSIVYVSNVSGKRDVWIMSADGTNPKQLTSNAGNNLHPEVSPDGRYIFFSSNRDNTGAFNIWRMNIDGSNPIQLTHGKGAVQATGTPDGQWVVYALGGPETPAVAKTLWKVPVDGGESARITNTPSNGAAISPDGTTIACWYKQDKSSPWQIALLSFAGRRPLKLIPVTRTSNFRLRWTPDGQAISYINTRDGVSNIWIQPINGEPARQLTQFTSEFIEGFDWTPNGDLICARNYTARDIVRISDFR